MRLITADQHDKAYDSTKFEAKEERTTLPHSVREEATSDSAGTSNEINGDSHQLGLICRVPKFLDYCRQEKRDGVKGSEESDGDEHIDVDLPVSKSLDYILEVEIIGQSIPVFKQPSLNFGALNGCQEVGTTGLLN